METTMHRVTNVKAGVIHDLTKTGTFVRALRITTLEGETLRINIFADSPDKLKIENRGAKYL